MKLDSPLIAKLNETMTLAVKLGMEVAKITPEFISCSNDSKTIALLQTTNIPNMPFDVIGLHRLPLLKSRIDLMQGLGAYTVDASIDTRASESTVHNLTFRSGRIKMGFNCYNPKFIKAMKSVPEYPEYHFGLDPDVVPLLSRGHAIMKSEWLYIIGNGDTITFKIVDMNNDTLEQEIDIDFEFTKTVAYPLKPIITVFKKALELYGEDATFGITEGKGMISIPLHDFTVYMMAKVD